MESIKYLQLGNSYVYPITRLEAVIDKDGSTVVDYIDNEKDRAQAAELVLTNNLNTEISRAQSAETQLNDDLVAESNRAKAAELQEKNDREAAVAAETARATEVEDGLDTRLEDLEALIDSDHDGIINKFNEIVDFLANIEEPETLANIIEGINQNINQEVNDRIADVDSEQARAEAAEAIEKSEREAAISAEQLARETLDTLHANQIAALAANSKITTSVNPTVIYKGIDQTVTATSTFTADDNSLIPTSISISSPSETSTNENVKNVTLSATINTTENTVQFTSNAVVLGLSLNSKTTLNARYPIYYGFGSSYDALVSNSYQYPATVSANRTYPVRTNNADENHYYMLVPTDVTASTLNFSVGGAPMAMTKSTETINNQVYNIYTSNAVYPVGAQLAVLAY